MATPAEIIAARVNGTYVDEPQPVAAAEVVVEKAAPKLLDENAFPTLGGKKSASVATPSWGPGVKVSSPAKVSAPVSNGHKFKSSTIQDAFSLDADDQLNVARPDFIKILTSIKNDTNTNIECTTSQHTKKRTFLITGKPEQVKHAKRLVIKKLTKPVKISVAIPAKIRSRVIGQQGRVIKPIIQANEVRIDVEQPKEDVEGSDDPFENSVQVVIEGDVEGCRNAKHQILAIVREETKNWLVGVPLSDAIKPFAKAAVDPIVSEYSDLVIDVPTYKTSGSRISIVGETQRVLEAKTKILAALNFAESTLSAEEVPIPKIKHQFLPIDEVLEQYNVLIEIGDSNVKFIGPSHALAAAKEAARQTTSQYKVEVIEMSKAHKGNLPHVRAVAALLTKNGTFDEISSAHSLSINTPASLLSDLIPIELVDQANDPEKIKSAKKAIVAKVNQITPAQTHVIDDINPFLLKRVPAAISTVATDNAVEWVIVGDRITLFKAPQESDDFDDADDSEAFGAVNQSLASLRALAGDLESVSIPLEGQKDVILGPRGTTLAIIKQSVDANSVTVEVSDDEVSINGIKGDVATIKKQVTNALALAKEGNFLKQSSEFEIPASVVGRIIGKGGNGLDALSSKYGVSIHVEGGDKTEASSVAQVRVDGPKLNVDAAATALAQQSKKLADETTVVVKIEQRFHRRMIGAGGVYINRLRDKYSVKINFPAASGVSSPLGAKNDEVVVKGPSKGVTKAVDELKELYQFEKDSGFKQSLQIPQKAISRVIGKGGETIRDIADGAGVEYHIAKEANEEGVIELELTGSKTALKDAVKRVTDIVDEAENFVSVSVKVDPKYHRDLVGPNGSVMRDIISKAGGENVSRSKYNILLQIPDAGSGNDEVTSKGDKRIVDKIIAQVKELVALKEAAVTENFELPKEKHRLIIGPGGLVRRELEEQFGITINVPRSSDESTQIKLVGLPEKLEALKEKLADLTKDDWNEVVEVPLHLHALVSERGAIFKDLKRRFSVDVVHGNLSRKASQVSSASLPAPPADATGFTTADFDHASEKVIPWKFKGSPENTAKAAKLVEERLTLATSATTVGWYHSEDGSALRKLVGPQGKTIKDIRTKTNTFISVPRSDEPNGNYVYVVGGADEVQAAAAQIKARLA